MNDGSDKSHDSPAPQKEQQQYQSTENGDGEIHLRILSGGRTPVFRVTI